LKKSVNHTVRKLRAKKPTILKHIVKAKVMTFKTKQHKQITVKPIVPKSKKAVKVNAVKSKNYWHLAMEYARKVTKNLKIANADHESGSHKTMKYHDVGMDITMSKGMVSAVKDGRREDKIDLKKEKLSK